MFRVSMRAPERKGFASGLALALALTASAGFTVPAQAQSDAPQYSKDFAKAANATSTDINAARARPEVATEINNLIAASTVLQSAEGDAVAPARAQFDAVSQRIKGLIGPQRQALEALALSAKNPDDKYLAGDLMTFVGSFSGDREIRAKGLRLKLESGVMKPQSLASGWFELGQLYYVTNHPDDSRMAYEAAYKAGELDGAIYAADSYYSANRVAEGLDYLEGLIVARTVAGQDVPQTWYGNGLNHARELGDANRVGHWAALYAARGNSPQSWNASMGLLIAAAKYGLPEQLDVYRLMERTDALLTETNYTGYLQAALGPAGVAYPGEVIKVAEAAQKSGKVTQNGPFVTNALNSAREQVAKDEASLPQQASDARGATDGADALNAGDAFLSYDKAAEAEEMFSLALTKGGIDNDHALTRLAIAQVEQGKYADARTNFAKVSGTRAPIAAMWLAYIDTKAGRST